MKKIIFFNTTWMQMYQGLSGNDTNLKGGGSYVDKHGCGGEIYNFQNFNGKAYGYVQAPGKYGNINFKKLGENEKKSYIKNVLVIFTARHHEGGTYIVGWYKNAILYRQYQKSDINSRFINSGWIAGYYAETDFKNATLLPEDLRLSFPEIPRGKNFMGQSNVWYANSQEAIKLKKEILKAIEEYEKNKKINHKTVKNPKKIDQEKKKKVEKAAVDFVIAEYQNRGFEVVSREKENIGWDLDAKHKKITLYLEVKGLSGNEVSAEISKNEYEKMQIHKDKYRICIVTNALKSPQLYIFLYSHEKNSWIHEETGEKLIIEEKLSARCYI